MSVLKRLALRCSLQFGPFVENKAPRHFKWVEGTGLLGAVRPLKRHRSPRQAFRGRFGRVQLGAVRGNEWTRSQEQLELRRKLASAYPMLGRAIALREALQALADGDLPSICWWLGWADRSRLKCTSLILRAGPREQVQP